MRRIYAEYVEGRSPMKIVRALNSEGIPGPRGGQCNVSALIGSAKRRNGLLNNSLYSGRITYNRQSFIKDPATGRRQARANAPEKWLTQEVPELAIVSPEVFEAAEVLRTTRGRANPVYKRRPKHLRELAEIRRKIKWLVGEIENGRGSPSVSDRLYEVETRQEAVKSQLALAAGSDIVELHPQAVERYAAKVAEIHAALARGDDAGQEAIAWVRELVTRVRVIPRPQGEPVGLEIGGDLAAILSVNETGSACMVSMVAGARFSRDRHILSTAI